ncbi:MAG: S24/S26 family peptidase [Firmicutes bacterium]|nr:S24/S26 family peptidase [Candidatus Colivicinus equi]
MIKESNIEETLIREHFIISGHSGNSMYPLILADDQLLIMEVNRPISLYDVVAYRVNDKCVLHRIIGVKDDCFIIRGDNTIKDEYVEKNRIIGYLDTIYRKDKDIKITDRLNREYYYRSLVTLYYRRFIFKLKKVIKKVIGYE